MKGLLIFLLLFPFFSNSQMITWDKTYDLNLQDYGHGIVQTYDGGYVLTGYTGDYNWPNLLVMKLSNKGDTLWSKVYANEGHSSGNSICNTADSCFVVSGFTSDSEMYTLYEMYILKLNQEGDTIWTKKYGGGNTVAGSVIQTLDGGYVILGGDYAFDLHRVIILKLNENGEEEWEKTYIFNSSPGPHFFSSIEQNNDSSFILAGSFPRMNGYYDIWLMKLDSHGDSIWTKRHGDPTINEYGYYALPAPLGGYMISAAREISYSKNEMVFMKLDNNGNYYWEKSFGGDAEEMVYIIRNTADFGFVGTGSYIISSGIVGMYIVKLNSQCDTLWTKVYYQNARSRATDIHVTSDFGYIVSGGAANGMNFYRDIRVLKLDGYGLVNTQELKKTDNKTYIRNYPNPCQNYTNLEYETDNYIHKAKIIFYNSKGLYIREIPLTGIHQGKNILRFNTSDLPNGIYYYTLITKTAKVSSRMIKIQ